jgi:hypothetical protein
MDWEKSEYDPESDVVKAAIDSAQSFRSLKPVYINACSDVNVNSYGFIQICQTCEPRYSLCLTPTFTGTPQKPKAEIRVTLAEGEDGSNSDGGFGLTNELQHGRPLLNLEDLE